MTADMFSDRTWFAVVSKPRMWEAVEKGLELRGYSVFLPKCLVLRRHARRVDTVERPLFGRYMFAGLTTEQPFMYILHTPGVAFVLRDAAGIALPVSPIVLRDIKARVDADGGAVDLVPKPVKKRHKRYRKNQRLRVTEGPFEGFEGLYVASQGERITLLLDILQRTVKFQALAGWVTDDLGSPGPAGAVVGAAE